MGLLRMSGQNCQNLSMKGRQQAASQGITTSAFCLAATGAFSWPESAWSNVSDMYIYTHTHADSSAPTSPLLLARMEYVPAFPKVNVLCCGKFEKVSLQISHTKSQGSADGTCFASNHTASHTGAVLTGDSVTSLLESCQLCALCAMAYLANSLFVRNLSPQALRQGLSWTVVLLRCCRSGIPSISFTAFGAQD